MPLLSNEINSSLSPSPSEHTPLNGQVASAARWCSSLGAWLANSKTGQIGWPVLDSSK
jgi:hypothetical protein